VTKFLLGEGFDGEPVGHIDHIAGDMAKFRNASAETFSKM